MNITDDSITKYNTKIKQISILCYINRQYNIM